MNRSTEEKETDGPLSRIARLLKEKLDAKGIMIVMLDDENDIGIGTNGFAPEQLPTMLRFLSKVVRARLDGHKPIHVRDEDIVNAGECPSCNVGLMFPRGPFMESKNKYVVCQCGSFLIPVIAADSTVSVRCLTIDEVAELPDEIRNNLLRSRREQEARAEADE